MAADVTSLIRILNGGGGGGGDQNSPSGLITRDLLGGGGGGGSGGHRFLDSKELDLDMQVPSGWEKRLDLKSGKVYLQRCESSNSSSSSDHNKKSNKNNNVGLSKFQDLNLPPSMKQPTANLLDEPPSLELKLVPSSSSESPSASPLNYQSVCTLDKVKSALERAERLDTMRKRSISMSSSPASNSSSSIKDWAEADDHEERSGPQGGGGSFAAGCPKCLLYVLISVENPRCPGCGTTVPLPRAVVSGKKPRIDLNISM